jgi:YesN/AraC family two-component response regulator
MLAVILQMNLFDAIPYSDSEMGLQAAKDLPPDYPISDIVMPRLDGIDLAIAIQIVAPTCKVLT